MLRPTQTVHRSKLFMTPNNSPLGRHIKSVATYLTRWMRVAKKETEVPEVTDVKAEEVAVPKQRVVTPVKTRAARPAPKKKPTIIAEPEPEPEPKSESHPSISTPATGILVTFPDAKNLVGQPEVSFTLNDKKHTLMARADSIFIDAQKYLVSAGGGALGADVELDILDFKRIGNMLMLRAGAFGKEGTVMRTEKELEADLEMLLKGKLCKLTTDKNLTFEIARNTY